MTTGGSAVCQLEFRYNSGMKDWRDHLVSKPTVCGGELCARGTRIPVTVILDNIAEGSTREEILRSYPSVRPEHLDAALLYAADLAHKEQMIPLQPI